MSLTKSLVSGTTLAMLLAVPAFAVTVENKSGEEIRIGTDRPLAGNKARSTEGMPTSNRTPERRTTIPLAQVDTTKSGETSDRTPHKGSDGAASGEKGVEAGSKSQIQAWDETYRSDKAQEQQLKAGGKAR